MSISRSPSLQLSKTVGRGVGSQGQTALFVDPLDR